MKAEIINVRNVSDSMIYETQSVFDDFNNNGVSVSEMITTSRMRIIHYPIISFIS